MIYLYIYIAIASLGSIYLSRKYWLNWRATPSKYNIYTGKKIADRSVDSYVFIIAFIFNLLFFPLACIEYAVRVHKEKRGKTYVK